MSEVIFTDDNFNAEVIGAKMPVLVDFWAPWCGPCQMMSPIISALAKEFDGKIKIGKLNVDENPVTAGEYAVMSIPTLKIFKEGKVVDEIIGVQPAQTIAQKLSSVLK